MYQVDQIKALLSGSKFILKPRRGDGGGGGCVLTVMHGRSRMTIDPRIPSMPGRSTSGFHRPGRHRYIPSGGGGGGVIVGCLP